MNRKIIWTFVLITTTMLVACGGGGGNSSTAPPPVTAPTGLSYSGPQTYSAGVAITILSPTVTGSASSYSVSPAFPAGLTLNANSGQISGTPSRVTAQANYTITASNSAGSTTSVLSVAVVGGAPLSGIFRDANVGGLSYVSGAHSGVTGVDGSFVYETGADVTFSVGAVVVGTVFGWPLRTPAQMDPSGSATATTTVNRLRFLQMLDNDGNPSNGITISAAVRTIAANWAQVDWSTTNLPAALTSVIADAASVDGVPHALPDATTASARFKATMDCTYAGIFQGNFAGSDNGPLAVALDANGKVEGQAYSNTDQAIINILDSTGDYFGSLYVNNFYVTGATYSGVFLTPDAVSNGLWRNSTSSGTFTATRIGGATAPVYRFAKFIWPAGTAFLLVVEIDAADHITGYVLDLATTNPVAQSLAGSLSGTAVSATTSSSRYTVSAAFNKTSTPLQMIGNLTDTSTQRTAPFGLGGPLKGCRLN